MFITIPSPHISLQVLAVEELPDVQLYPVSTLQLESHPSPFTVLLSSQYPEVGTITLPSPQISVQTLATVELPDVQEYPVSTAQLLLHPSPLFVFPSSHEPLAGIIIFPSPHISVHTLLEVEVPKVHVYPASTAH